MIWWSENFLISRDLPYPSILISSLTLFHPSDTCRVRNLTMNPRLFVALVLISLSCVQFRSAKSSLNKLRLFLSRRSYPSTFRSSDDGLQPQEECYRTECFTDVYRVMKAISEREERLVYCKDNRRCDCCIRPDLTPDEELLFYKQLKQENDRLGVDSRLT